MLLFPCPESCPPIGRGSQNTSQRGRRPRDRGPVPQTAQAKRLRAAALALALALLAPLSLLHAPAASGAACQPPTGVTATKSGTTVTLSWTQGSDCGLWKALSWEIKAEKGLPEGPRQGSGLKGGLSQHGVSRTHTVAVGARSGLRYRIESTRNWSGADTTAVTGSLSPAACAARTVAWGAWTPAADTACTGTDVDQSRAASSCTAGQFGSGTCVVECPADLADIPDETRTVDGADPCLCEDRTVTWGSWTPGADKACSGTILSQSRPATACTAGKAGSGSCDVDCPADVADIPDDTRKVAGISACDCPDATLSAVSLSRSGSTATVSWTTAGAGCKAWVGHHPDTRFGSDPPPNLSQSHGRYKWTFNQGEGTYRTATASTSFTLHQDEGVTWRACACNKANTTCGCAWPKSDGTLGRSVPGYYEQYDGSKYAYAEPAQAGACRTTDWGTWSACDRTGDDATRKETCAAGTLGLRPTDHDGNGTFDRANLRSGHACPTTCTGWTAKTESRMCGERCAPGLEGYCPSDGGPDDNLSRIARLNSGTGHVIIDIDSNRPATWGGKSLAGERVKVTSRYKYRDAFMSGTCPATVSPADCNEARDIPIFANKATWPGQWATLVELRGDTHGAGAVDLCLMDKCSDDGVPPALPGCTPLATCTAPMVCQHRVCKIPVCEWDVGAWGTWDNGAPSTICPNATTTRTRTVGHNSYCTGGKTPAATKPATTETKTGTKGQAACLCTARKVIYGYWAPPASGTCEALDVDQVKPAYCSDGQEGDGSCSDWKCPKDYTTLYQTRTVKGTKPSTHADCQCTARTVTHAAWAPAASGTCVGIDVVQTQAAACTAGQQGDGSCSNWQCPSDVTTLDNTRTVKGTKPSTHADCQCTARTVTHAAWAPAASGTCETLDVVQTQAASCAAGQQGDGSCGNWQCPSDVTTLDNTRTVKGTKSSTHADCVCTARTVTFGNWDKSASNHCTGTTFTRKRTATACTDGSQGDGSCSDWQCPADLTTLDETQTGVAGTKTCAPTCTYWSGCGNSAVKMPTGCVGGSLGSPPSCCTLSLGSPPSCDPHECGVPLSTCAQFRTCPGQSPVQIGYQSCRKDCGQCPTCNNGMQHNEMTNWEYKLTCGHDKADYTGP